MSFLHQLKDYEKLDFAAYFDAISAADVARSLRRDILDPADLLNLLSPQAENFLEEMAEKAQSLTRQHFGSTIGLYTPLYISDFCTNYCTYCGFNSSSRFKRTRLSLEEIEAEARAIYAMGIRHILVLTGEAPKVTPIDYLHQAIKLLSQYFPAIALEMFPLEEHEYSLLKSAGADSLTIYQETYNRTVYQRVHPRGRKVNFDYRLFTPDRGARAGFRALNIGALFGLAEPRSEAFRAALHGRYLEKEYSDVEISLSLPRMTRAEGGIQPQNILSDSCFVQIMLAWRLFMPRLGITISTRESAGFRDKLVHLGVTRFSAGSRTDVGGYAKKKRAPTVQFEITDTRSVDQVAAMIRQSGYQPVFKDWEQF